MDNRFTKNKGITLLILAITISIIGILAGITVVLTLDKRKRTYRPIKIW